MFYFKLHPLQWNFSGDATTIFRALELASGNYLISYILKDGRTVELIYTKREVESELAEQHWLIVDANESTR